MIIRAPQACASVDAAQLWTLNHRLLTVVMDAFSAELAELGLDTKEFFVLAEVSASPYPAELAATLMMPKASVTVYVRCPPALSFVGKQARQRQDRPWLSRLHLRQHGNLCFRSQAVTCSAHRPGAVLTLRWNGIPLSGCGSVTGSFGAP
ncbi:hypothetical protein [Kibdelosporangium aridum]|uniref:hypothetical protein n=1 Tax=Kibdelosporangium aridum TaxID=2030 RepID=UPI00406BA811